MTLVKYKKDVDPRLVNMPPIQMRKVRRSQWASAVQWAEFKAHGCTDVSYEQTTGELLVLFSDSTRLDRLQAALASGLFDSIHCPLSYSECVGVSARIVPASITVESVVWL